MRIDQLRSHVCALALLMAVAGINEVKAQVAATDGRAPLTIEHRVAVRSTVPAIAGQQAELYVRERVLEGTLGSTGEREVVLFVHGAGTPAEVAFDVPHSTYSWMGYLALAGFDAFSVDMTGYGRSTRPPPMDDPCNLPEQQQDGLIPAVLTERCAASYPYQLTTIESDWNDIDAVVEYIRELRDVERVSMVAWSLGGPRAGGYAARNPDRVSRLVLLAPAYSRNRRTEPPGLPAAGTPVNVQDRTSFLANWERQVGCPGQYETEVGDAVWRDMLASDPVGASWGAGHRRAPSTTTWGWGPVEVGGTSTPTLLVSPPHDRQVPPERVRDLFDDLGASNKLLIDLACTSHNAMWETNHLLLFEASREWLASGTVRGQRSGTLRLGY
ncbi:MAG: alpha/beta fold hydrolase [Gemmatimonadota bacterium]